MENGIKYEFWYGSRWGIRVSFSEDNASLFKGFTLKLTDTTKELVSYAVVTNDQHYTIGTPDIKSVYALELISPRGEIATIIKGINFTSTNDFTIILPMLDVPKTITLSVKNTHGDLLTLDYIVNWYYNGILCEAETGNTISTVIDPAQYAYQIVLTEKMGILYKEPTMQSVSTVDENFTLEPIPNLAVTGRVVTSDEQPIENAELRISQTLNGRFAYAQTVTTDAQGEFTATVRDGATSITITKSGYFNKSLTNVHNQFTSDPVDLGNIEMEALGNNRITLTLLKAFATREDEEPFEIGLYSTNNIEFGLYNLTQDKEITTFIAQYPYLTLDDDLNGAVAINFTENGSFEAIIANSDNKNRIAMLFNENGEYLSTHSVIFGRVNGSPLSQGNYTLVFMGKSDLLSRISHISKLYGYSINFVEKEITISNGKILTINIPNIPYLDESTLFYTNNHTTFFVPNKNNAPAGTLLTMRAEYEIKDIYETSNQRLVFDIPQGVQFVDNSITVDGLQVAYVKDGNRVTIHTNAPKSVVRFYAAATIDGSHIMDATLSFTLDGSTISQPIGSVSIDATALEIFLQKETGHKNVTIRGIAMPHSAIRVFDNDVFVGETTANSAGSWQLGFELITPSTFSYHDIYAKKTAPGGITAMSERKQLFYNATRPDLTKVTMIYNGVSHVIDFINPYPPMKSYNVLTGNTSYTFTAEFIDTSRVSDVRLITFDSQGRKTFINMVYDSKKDLFIGTHTYTFHTIPTMIDAVYTVDDKLIFPTDEIRGLYATDGKGNGSITASEEEVAQYEAYLLKLSDDDYNKEVQGFLDLLDEFDDLIAEYEAALDDLGWGKEDDSIIVRDASEYDERRIEGQGFSKIELDDGSFIYVKITDDEIKTVDFKANHAEIFTIPSVLKPLLQSSTALELDMIEINTLLMQYAQERTDPRQLITDAIRLMGKIEKTTSEITSSLYDLSLSIGLAGNPLLSLRNAHKNMDLMYKVFFRNGNVWRDTPSAQKLKAKQAEIAHVIATNPKVDGALKVLELFSDNIKKVNGFIGKIFLVEQIRSDIRKLQQLLDDIERCCSGTCEYMALLDFKLYELILKINLHYAAVYVFFETLKIAISFAPYTKGMSLIAVILASGAIIASVYYFDKWKKGFYKTLNNSIIQCRRDCGDTTDIDDDDNQDGNNPKPCPPYRLDPSGYVYEAVASNRLEGVTATCYYSATAQGDNTEFWDASEHDQENPLITDREGFYAWDVPIGWWKVTYEKNGYEPTNSVDVYGWLPVPPPQTEVHVGMISKAVPQVVNAIGYEAYIEITFDRYMDITMLNKQNITLTGYAGDYNIHFANAEENPSNPEKVYATIVHIIPSSSEYIMGNTVGLNINKAVESYAGINMSADYQVDIEIKLEPKTIECPKSVSLNYGETREISVSVLPVKAGIGKKITSVSNSPMIVSTEKETTTDNAATATFTITGELSGAAQISLLVDGTQVAATINVNVLLPDQTIPSPTVDPIEDFVTRFYQKILGRYPDPDWDGLDFWINGIKEGRENAATITDEFFFGPEFISLNVPNEKYIEVAYRTLLGREADDDPEGRDFWLKALENGFYRRYIIDRFLASPEFTALCDKYIMEVGPVVGVEGFVFRMYKNTLERRYDQEGLDFWVNGLNDKLETGASIVDYFFFGPEFEAKDIPDIDFVRIAYATLMNRDAEADEEGRDHWHNSLSQGLTRRAVLNEMLSSAEFSGICEDYGIDIGDLTQE